MAPLCGDAHCPVAVVSEHYLSSVQPSVLPAGSVWWRGTQYPATALVPGVGETRFAPLPATSHAYVGFTKTVALLESALHNAAGSSPVIFVSQLRDWTVHQLELTQDVRVADLRDDQLSRLALTRDQLVDTTARHYPCTRQWAAALQAPATGASGYAGAVWHSRQAQLFAQQDPDSLMADVLRHVAAEVAVLWSPLGPTAPFTATGASISLVEHGQPTRFLQELAYLIGASFE